MAKEELTGVTADELEEMRQEFEGTPASKKWEFEQVYCLVRIGKQPEDYDGPQRYCSRYTVMADKENDERGDRCPFHGGVQNPAVEHLDKLANMSHGFYATRKHLFDNFEDFEIEFYKEVMDEWPEKYGIDLESDPSAKEDLHALAIEIVRDHRANDEISKHKDLTVQVPKYNEHGEVVGHEDKPHHLIDAEQRQRRLIMAMKKELGISRAHRDKINAQEDASNTVAGLVEGMKASLDADKHEYDPDAFGDDDENDDS